MRRISCPYTLAAIGILGLSAFGCDVGRTPVILSATPEAVVLVQDTEKLCAKTAREAAENIQEEGGTENVSRRLREYFDGPAAPDFAAVDKAGEILDGLLPKVRLEASTEIADAVEELWENQKKVCAAARTAPSVLLDYQDNVKYTANDYVAARDKLASLYTVPEAAAQFARHKFSLDLEEARAAVPPAQPEPGMKVASAEQYDRERKEWEKTQDYQARQQAEHDAAVDRWRAREEENGGKRQPMVGTAASTAATQVTPQAWSAAYAPRAAAVRSALDSYLEVRGEEDNEEIPTLCQELYTAAANLLADAAALSTPDRVASQSLKRAYVELRDCAQSCAAGRKAEATFHLGGYQTALREVATALRPYGVAP